MIRSADLSKVPRLARDSDQYNEHCQRTSR
jgi:hypothetical protein